MSAATATPKGQRRREALITAAADLLLDGGYEAVRHRSVAARARLPLASTTYYFSSLDDLVARAVELNSSRELDVIRERLRNVAPRPRNAPATAELIVDLLVGPADGDGERRDLLLARYERFIASARHPELRALQLRHRVDMEDVVGDAFTRAGRTVDRERVHRLMSMLDGVILDAFGELNCDPRERVRDVLLDLVDREAPLVDTSPADSAAPIS